MESSQRQPCFGLRIESHSVQLAIATPTQEGCYQLSFDQIERPIQESWLSATGQSDLERSLETLAERHQMRRHRIAVSLDGDFCVTRVSIGSANEVDRELESLADRIPRYLQLGPGEKVTGNARMEMEPGTEYAITGVVNQSLIQIIYNAFRNVDVEVAWVEPSLVSIARLLGCDEKLTDVPILIADGAGKYWDVGIACNGRLLLDYRPAAARDTKGFCEALTGHFSRLQRFCHRHRGIVSGGLSELLLGGGPSKTSEVIDHLKDSATIKPRLLESPQIDDLYLIAPEDRIEEHVSAVATVYPLIKQTSTDEIPDLLDHVRRAADMTLGQRLVVQCWPVAAACLVMMVSFLLVSRERKLHQGSADGRADLQSEISATKIKFLELARCRNLVDQLERIEQKTQEQDWDEVLSWVTKTLPPEVKLNEYRVDRGSVVQLDGVTRDETIVYDLVNSLRRLPDVVQVALKGTTPQPDDLSTRFMVHLTFQPPQGKLADEDALWDGNRSDSVQDGDDQEANL